VLRKITDSASGLERRASPRLVAVWQATWADNVVAQAEACEAALGFDAEAKIEEYRGIRIA